MHLMHRHDPCRLFVHPAWRRMPFLSSPAPEALVFSTAFPLAAGSSSLSTGSWEADPWRTDEILLTSQSWELNTLFDWRSFTASPRWAHLPNNTTAWTQLVMPHNCHFGCNTPKTRTHTHASFSFYSLIGVFKLICPCKRQVEIVINLLFQ